MAFHMIPVGYFITGKNQISDLPFSDLLNKAQMNEEIFIMNYEKFVEELKNNEAFQNEYQAFMKVKDPKDDEAAYAVVIEFAAAKGYTITIEDIAAARAECRKLDDNELMIAQGGLKKCTSDYATSCSSSFKSGENCWHDDECASIYHLYKYKSYCTLVEGYPYEPCSYIF